MFFDDDGNFPLNEYNERIISIDSELLRGIPEVLAIAEGGFQTAKYYRSHEDRDYYHIYNRFEYRQGFALTA